MKPLDYIVKYWVVIVFAISGISTVAIGGQKIKTLEEAVRKQVAQADQVHEMKIEQKVLVERTKTIVKSMDAQKDAMSKQQELLLEILMKMEKQQ